MRRTFYTLLFCLFIGYCTYSSYSVQKAFAAPLIISRHVSVYAPGKQVYDQNVKHPGDMEIWLDDVNHLSANRVEKKFRSSLLINIHFTQKRTQNSFMVPLLPIKLQDLSSLWTQQHEKQNKEDVYNYGE